ncbi:hypothetical protein [Corynebacterium sp. AOP12-C2-36]|uniref:hypothetical protein n=1 Tax=Corynebacterium sp. AOP12-C2-36 TaxID=3457723 RepID=UPI004033A0F1
MATMQWVPYRWEPVHYEGSDFRLTFRLRGEVEEMELVLGDRVHPFILGEDGAQVVVPEAEALTVPDRAPVQVKIRTGGVWTVLAQGHLTRRGL